MIIFFNLSGFLIRDGPSIKVLIVSSGNPSTKDRLKVAGNNLAFLVKSHKTPPTMGWAGPPLGLVFTGPKHKSRHRIGDGD